MRTIVTLFVNDALILLFLVLYVYPTLEKDKGKVDNSYELEARLEELEKKTEENRSNLTGFRIIEDRVIEKIAEALSQRTK